jgi:hypothetical protein
LFGRFVIERILLGSTIFHNGVAQISCLLAPLKIATQHDVCLRYRITPANRADCCYWHTVATNFVRENKEAAYCSYVLHWKLQAALPMELFRASSVLRARLAAQLWLQPALCAPLHCT